jgi:hypothetical protein
MINKIIAGLFSFILLFVAADTFLQGTFAPDFSLIEILIDVMYIVGCLWTWKDILIQRLVYLDIITPLMFLLRMLFALVILLGDSAFDLFFDLISFFFGVISQALTSFGIPTLWEFPVGVVGQHASLDITTITIRFGLSLDVLGNGAFVEAQFSLFGCSELRPDKTRFVFDSLGVFGLQAKLNLLLLGSSDFIGMKTSLEDSISSAFQYFFSQNGSLEDVYNEMIDYLKN